MSGEVKNLRRVAFLLLAVLVLQLSGLRGLCAPLTKPMHDCCPAPQRKSLPSPAALPDCCRVAALGYQASVCELRTANEQSDSISSIVKVPAVGVAPAILAAAPDWSETSHPVSPPLSPLLQTCLLLI